MSQMKENGDERSADLNPGQHAGGGHTEVQISQAVRVGGFIESWSLLLWEII